MPAVGAVGNTVESSMAFKAGDRAFLHISGTYNLTLVLEKERSRGSNAWVRVKTYSTANATVAEYLNVDSGSRYRIRVAAATSGIATVFFHLVTPDTFTDRSGEPNRGYTVFGKQASILNGTLTKIASLNNGNNALWHYVTDDAASTVDTTGYFQVVAPFMNLNDMIIAVCSASGSQERGLMMVRAHSLTGAIDVTNINSLGLSNTD